ncbi:hypothetical protein ACFU7T_19105 [Streptomyces sp. NPDC057555]|uniref:hypothetical protein n=1 Tax=Streptomyces sp. NPDC057555 TaxID=3346166 RepID=UPI0036B4DDC7
MSSYDGDHIHRILKSATKDWGTGEPVVCDHCGERLTFTGRERGGNPPMVVVTSHCQNDSCPGNVRQLPRQVRE